MKQLFGKELESGNFSGVHAWCLCIHGLERKQD